MIQALLYLKDVLSIVRKIYLLQGWLMLILTVPGYWQQLKRFLFMSHYQLPLQKHTATK